MTTALVPTTGQAVAEARACVPNFTPVGAPLMTETSLLVPGTACGGREAFAKVPVDRRPFWLERARHEIAVYRALRGHRPAVRMPHLLGSDDRAPVLVITRLAGRPLATNRYPRTTLPPAALAALLEALETVHNWQAGGVWADDSDYPGQLAKLGLLTPGQLTMAAHTFTVARRLPLRLEFGDGHPGNALLPPNGAPLSLIDLEFLALRLPGYDHAVLWVLLGDHPANRRTITDAVPRQLPAQAAFWLAAALFAGRELSSHQRWAPTPERRGRIPRLRADLHQALDRLHALDIVLNTKGRQR